MISGEGGRHHGKHQDAGRKATRIRRVLRLVGWNALLLFAAWR